MAIDVSAMVIPLLDYTRYQRWYIMEEQGPQLQDYRRVVQQLSFLSLVIRSFGVHIQILPVSEDELTGFPRDNGSQGWRWSRAYTT